MRVRPAALWDRARIEELYREAPPAAVQTPPVRLWSLVSQTLASVLPLPQETSLLVAEDDAGRVLGFVQAATPRLERALPAHPPRLTVLDLSVAQVEGAEEIASALLDHLSVEAARRGAARLFARLAHDDPLVALLERRGFRAYAAESLLWAASPVTPEVAAPAGLRRRRAADDWALYHLYRRVTPRSVAGVEGPTLRDWKALQAGARQFVVDRGEVVGWVGVRPRSGTRPAALSFLAPPDAELVAGLVGYGLDRAGPGATWAGVRSYQRELHRVLREHGFEELLEQVLLVKELALVQREPVAEAAGTGLAPAAAGPLTAAS